MSKFLVLVTMMATLVYAKVNFVKDYQTALAMAKSDNKKILVMLTSEDCPSCWWMKNVAFKDEKLSELMNERIAAVEIDVFKDTIPLNLKYIGTPTFYLLDKNEDQLSRVDGRMMPEKFRQRLNIFLD